MTFASQIAAVAEAANREPQWFAAVARALTPREVTYWGYKANPAGGFDVALFRRGVDGKLRQDPVHFTYRTEQAAHDHCWMWNSVEAVTR